MILFRSQASKNLKQHNRKLKRIKCIFIKFRQNYKEPNLILYFCNVIIEKKSYI